MKLRPKTKGQLMSEVLTEEFLNKICNAESIDEVFQEEDFVSRSLSDYLQMLLDEKGLKRSQVVNEAQLNSTFGYQIFTGSRSCSRDKLLRIAFAMGLSVRETDRALQAAGHNALYSKNRRDAIIIFCLDKAYTLQQIEEELYRLGEPTLFSE